ncbi:MAG TPA: Cu(I)-responsive transcriptional regulator [Maritimibacter sp.]|nr:Cu(I)-responsive transcriptional regulator [Maritimibacter sp.]
MNISQAAEASGLPAKTIRYYEEIELVKPERNANGYRAFTDTDIHNLTFLARARALGFSIEDCRALLALYDDKSRASSDVRKIALRHLDEIEAKIADLTAMRDTLSHLVQTCHGDDRPDCPILKGLGDDDPTRT